MFFANHGVRHNSAVLASTRFDDAEEIRTIVFDARQVHLVETDEERLVALSIGTEQDWYHKTRSIIAIQVEISEQVRAIIPIRPDRDHLELSVISICSNRFGEKTRKA